MEKIIKFKACADCPHIFHGMKGSKCQHPETRMKSLEDVNTDNSIPDWCKLEDA